jgi:anti-sigma factor RsiW
MTPALRIPFLRDPKECEEVRARMTDYLDEELDVKQRRRVERHIRFCPRCRRALHNLCIVIDRLAGMDETPEAAEADVEVAARITQAWREHRE